MSEGFTAETTLGFTGNYPLKLDSAQRVPIPAKFKDVLDRYYPDSSSHVVLIPDYGKIKVLPLPVWGRLQEKLNGLDFLDPSSDEYRTYIFGNMAFCQLDGQNRVKLTPSLCGLAEIEKEAVFVGQQSLMEIWCGEKWREFNQATAKNLRNVMAEVFRNSRPGA